MAVIFAFLFIVAVLALGGLAIFTLNLWNRLKQAQAEIPHWREFCASAKNQYEGLVNKYNALANKYNEDMRGWNEQAAALKAEVGRLEKWKNVADAEVRAAQMTRTAQATLNTATAEANRLTTAANEQATGLLTDARARAAAQLAEADARAAACISEAAARAATQIAEANQAASSTVSEAKQQAKSLKGEAQAAFDSATTQGFRIVQAAQKKAEEIGGSAYEALKNASLYEQTVKAMKNTIKGYGDEYLIPPHSLLDGLADDFQHAQAGQELRNARERTRVMIRNGTAATCEYVEAARRETAVNFVTDAFNGKVDSILSRVKHDNAGKLGQEIRDAFTLVNYNGKAFRDARITEEYLMARLDELKWAAVAQHLALQDREEQRRAKEMAREEARAARERERALREAAKEEETMRRAVEQAKLQFEQATDEQKAMYEERLQEMAERLREIEERKQRAISMAQQTKKGTVYIISNIGSFGEDIYKIGLTRRWDPHDRVRELGDASVPFGFDVHAMILSEDAPALEKQLHAKFVLAQVNKINRRKEFFRVCLQQIREEIEELGLAGVQWTMKAEAREYRDTLATEKAIKDDPAKQEAWVKQQLELDLSDVEASDAEVGLDED